MKKILIIILAVILIGFATLMVYVNHRSVNFINQHLTQMLGRDASVDNVSLGFQSIEVSGLKIANPEYSNIKYAFTADSIEIDYDLSSLFKDVIIVYQITLENPKIGIELYNLTGTENNWRQILQNIPQSEISQGESKDTPLKKEKEVIIDKLYLNDMQIEAQSKLLGPYSILIPVKDEIIFNDLTSKKAIEIQSSLKVILKTILQVVKQLKGFKEIIQNESNEQGALNQILQSIIEKTPSEHEVTKDQKDPFDSLSSEIKEGAKKAKDFFQKIKKTFE